MPGRLPPALLVALAIGGCSTPDPVPPEPEWPPSPVVETVSLPVGTTAFDLVRVPGPSSLRPFAIGAREVTWKEFNAFRNRKDRGKDAFATPSSMEAYFGDSGIPADSMEPTRPLINVRWHAAIVYCEWLSRVTGAYYRLPTEAEWEYAARAGSTAETPERLADVAWYRENSGERTHAGGEKAPNAFGLHDMLGNVREYCLEPFAPPVYGPVLRGGSWASPAAELRFGYRQTVLPRWFEEDPQLPRSLWWLTSPLAATGIRVLRAAEASNRERREAYARQLEVRVLKHQEETVQTGGAKSLFRHVWGEIRNAGEHSLDEVEVMAFYLDSKGRPHRTDVESGRPGHPTFSKCWPVMANSAHEAPRAPLRPGETRPFEIFIPLSYDLEEQGMETRLGAAVTNLRFSPSR